MKNLLILRHAKALKGDPSLEDFDRPLNDVGLSQIPIVCTIIKQEKIMPELIISSSAKRTQQTAKLVADQISYKGKIVFKDEFYESKINHYLKTIETVTKEINALMLVGHNPTLEELIYFLTSTQQLLSTAGLCLINLKIDDWREISKNPRAEIIKTWQPKELM